jgi:transposase
MNAYELESPERKLVMWYKVKEKKELGLTKAQTARELGIDVKTVRKYLEMSYEEFKSSESYRRMYIKVLDPYESKVYSWLDEHPDLSASQIHDWLRERYRDLPDVNAKTVYNYVKYIRAKYDIEKPPLSSPRQYCKVEETAYGEYAQVDFGEMWMRYADRRKLKVYFFVMVLCRSRKKYAWFSKSPFTADMAVYAHEKAFEYYGGKPKKIIYDQDAVLIHSENLGDYVLTKSFNAYVSPGALPVHLLQESGPGVEGQGGECREICKVQLPEGANVRGHRAAERRGGPLAVADSQRTPSPRHQARTGRSVPDRTGIPESLLREARDALQGHEGV